MMADWVEIGRIEDVPRRGARIVRTSGPPIAVFRTVDDDIFALVNHCPHRGGPLSEGIVSGSTVACPLHNWVIDLASGHAHEPDIGCAPPIPVRLFERRIFLPISAFGAAPDGETARRWVVA